MKLAFGKVREQYVPLATNLQPLLKPQALKKCRVVTEKLLKDTPQQQKKSKLYEGGVEFDALVK